jgi:hypothetical protein
VNTLKLLPYINQSNVFIPGPGTLIGIQFIADPVSSSTLPQSQDRLTVQGSIGLDVNPIGADSKKNDEVGEHLRTRVATLELALEGRLTNVAANSLLGRNAGVGTVEVIPASTYATPAQVQASVSALIGGATQATLDTISELVAALENNPNFAATIASSLATKVDLTSNQSIDGIKTFVKPVKAYFDKDIVVKITTGINWTAGTWYAIPGLSIPFAFAEFRSYLLMANYQYTEGSNTNTYWQMGGHCLLPGGIGWKAAGERSESIMTLQCHYAADNILTFRSALGGQNRGLEVKTNFNIAISGLGFIEFALKRIC